jgi:hypothetical protein
MCPAGGANPPGGGLPARRHGRQAGLSGLLAGVVVFSGSFIVWARAALLRHFVTPPPAEDRVFVFGCLDYLRVGYCFY